MSADKMGLRTKAKLKALEKKLIKSDGKNYIFNFCYFDSFRVKSRVSKLNCRLY